METPDVQLAAGLDVRVPYLSEYFGVWAIEERAGGVLVERARQLDLRVHLATRGADVAAEERVRAATGGHLYPITAGVAMIPLAGPLMKHVSSFDEGTSTVHARRQIRAAVNDPEVASILLLIDSPGGTAAGTQELADDVAWAASQKTVYAQIDDLTASAAYWVASQAEKVFANRTALVGSIGTFMTVYDLSRMAEQEGIRVHVIRSGAFKGAGVPGTEITEEQLAYWQKIVNELNSHFLASVEQGRGLTKQQVAELADGRVHLAKDAKKLGLIDGVQSIDQTMTQLRKAKPKNTAGDRRAAAEANPSSSDGDDSMSEPAATSPASPAAPAAATIEQLEQACPKADEKFLLAQLKQKATVEQAKSAWMTELSTRLEASEQARAQAAEAAKAKTAEKPKAGIAPLGTSNLSATAHEGDPLAEWNSRVDAKIKAGIPRAAAVSQVAAESPELREAMVAAHNAAHRTPRR